jgi:hypothetical protein
MFRGCLSRASHAIKIVVPDTFTDRTAAEAVLPGLELCHTHATKAKASEFFAVAPALTGALIRDACEGCDPNFSEAYVEAIAIGSLEHKAHVSAADAGKPN